jgi:hypothetical protein
MGQYTKAEQIDFVKGGASISTSICLGTGVGNLFRASTNQEMRQNSHDGAFFSRLRQCVTAPCDVILVCYLQLWVIKTVVANLRVSKSVRLKRSTAINY